MTTEAQATQDLIDELEYLRWFHGNADFGPADGDVRHGLNRDYVRETGKPVPDGYDEE